MSGTARKVAKRVLAVVVVLGLGVGVVVGLANRQAIQDSFAAIGYEPSVREAQLLDDLDLTREGERIFRASHPTVDGSQYFTQQCAEVDHSEQGHVLGCYSNHRIHLFDVTDERVSGVVEVTAVHELLHAAYARLGEGDKLALAEKLRREYERLAPSDPALVERMSVYEHLSEAAFANELHSVFGTEVRELPDWLEDHYGQWLEDRDALLDRFDAYHSVFAGLQAEASTLSGEMETLRADVEQRKVEYDADVTAFNAETNDLNARNKRKEFARDPDEFNRIRDGLELRREELASRRDALQSDIDRYNEMRSRLVELSELSAELDQQLNSELAPISSDSPA